VILYKLKIPHLLATWERIPYLNEEMIKVLSCEGMSVKKFLNDIFKSKRKYSYTLHGRWRSLPLFEEVVDSLNHKE